MEQTPKKRGRPSKADIAARQAAASASPVVQAPAGKAKAAPKGGGKGKKGAC
jgi:hypothetical protein